MQNCSHCDSFVFLSEMKCAQTCQCFGMEIGMSSTRWVNDPPSTTGMSLYIIDIMQTFKKDFI